MSKNDGSCPRMGRVGGQAVLEGVMMRSGDRTALAVRKESGEIVLDAREHIPLRKKYKFLNIPVLRGVVNFAETLLLSYRTLMQSADMLGLDDGAEDSKTVSPTRFFKDTVLPAMDGIRATVDALEECTDASAWPYPTYGAILFSVK